MSTRRFALAPMSLGLRALTSMLLTLPALIVAAAAAAPPPARWVLAGAGVFFLLVYAGVWLLLRPSRFEVDSGSLRIVWPLRSRRIARQLLGPARLLDAGAFRAEFGRTMRMGAGGLWGGFGLLATDRSTLSMWISRTDRFVLVPVRGERTLMLTPDQAERFVEALLQEPAPGHERSR